MNLNRRDPNPPVGPLIDDWLQQLSGSQCKVALFLLAAAAGSPDGIAAQSILEIADGTGLSWRTVHTILHDLDTHRVLEVLSQDKERTLVRFVERTRAGMLAPRKRGIRPGPKRKLSRHRSSTPVTFG